jgi:alpha-N-acetylglucosaminidase
VPGTAERFTLSGRPGDIEVAATTTSALTMGAGWYLKYVAHADVNIGGPAAPPVLPAELPAPAAPISESADARNRFVFNDTNDGYTDPNLSWSGWQRTLDVLALHGVNEVYVTVGAEAVYQQLFEEFGYSAAQMRSWIPQPAHQPWWLLQNLSSDQAPITQRTIDARAALGRRIADRARELGMTPALPGYFGTVPADFADRHPGTDVVPQGTWNGYQRPGWLAPTDGLFPEVAAAYYRLSDRILGPSGMYKMDPLHEGGEPGNVDVTAAATAVEHALRTAHPNAVWAILGWQSNPKPAVLAGVTDKRKMLIVDGLSDRYATWNREQDWPGVPYAFGSIYDFGGHTTLGANLQVWLDRYYAAQAKAGSDEAGVAIMPEGFDNNPAAFELLAELPWHSGSFDLAGWLRSYALGRYGSDAAAEAWTTLARTAYAEPADGWSEAADGLFAAQPNLTAQSAATWSPHYVRYDAKAFARALPQLLAAAPSVVQRGPYAYDLADVARQVLANRSRTLLPEIDAAYQAKDLARFDLLTREWLSLIKLDDRVVGTSPDFLLGTRYAAAATPELKYDLLSLYTVWGTRDGWAAGLADYANREWKDLLGQYYAPRWALYFGTLRTALTSGEPPAAVDWYAYGDDWAKAPHTFATGTSGDIRALAGEVVGAAG